MAQLPISHMTLYKHGVGYFRRRGQVEGEAIALTFRREEMDDLLKSLTVVDHGSGQVRGVDYETPQSQAERLAGCSVVLKDTRSLRDLLAALRGRSVRLLDGDAGGEAGTLLGLDEDEEKPLERSLVSILRQGSDRVIAVPLARVSGVEVRDESAAADLRFFLQTTLGQETHRSITIRLSAGTHDLEVSYVAPAPTWRVSYRLVTDASATLLQGWGIFHNRLEEDLVDISLSLTAGMPISFVYDLYTPHTPVRPQIRDEARVAAPQALAGLAAGAAMELSIDGLEDVETMTLGAPRPAGARRASLEQMAASAPSAASGRALGELFQYDVNVPVTVERGKSAMVPIVSCTMQCRKDLIYNGARMPEHPVATLRFANSTGLTLERGPVTVIEDGEYVGEAVLPFASAGVETAVPYAVELGVHVKEEQKEEGRLMSIRIMDGYLLQNAFAIRRTTYRIGNRTTQDKRVLVERAPGEGYEIVDTPDPVEKTLDALRFGVDAPAGSIVEFVVTERRPWSRNENLRDLSLEGLQRYFANRLLDQRAHDGLKAVLELWAGVAALEKSIAEEEKRRGGIHKSQEQMQKNMGVLSADGEEGKLRSRYVGQLTAAEEQLAGIDANVARMRADIAARQAEAAKLTAALAG